MSIVKKNKERKEKKKSHAGLEQHEGAYMMTEFSELTLYVQNFNIFNDC